jgi:hypothetical protein
MTCRAEGVGGAGRFPRGGVRAERGVIRRGLRGRPGFPRATGAKGREAV